MLSQILYKAESGMKKFPFVLNLLYQRHSVWMTPSAKTQEDEGVHGCQLYQQQKFIWLMFFLINSSLKQLYLKR